MYSNQCNRTALSRLVPTQNTALGLNSVAIRCLIRSKPIIIGDSSIVC